MTAWAAELRDAPGADGVLIDPDVTAASARDQAAVAGLAGH
jgi:glycolate oxidase